MVEVVTTVAVLLLVLAVVGSALPAVPGPALSVVGVLLYWWGSGFTEPGTALLVALLALALLALVADWTASAVSARLGGASLRTTIAAGLAGVVFLFVLGPLGAIAGVVATVFLLEFHRHRDAHRGARTAAVVVLGMLGSTVVQVLLTTTVLVAFAVGVFL